MEKFKSRQDKTQLKDELTQKTRKCNSPKSNKRKKKGKRVRVT